MCRLKSKVARHFVLQSLDIGGKELYHLSTIGTDHVVVMLVVVVMFVVGFVVAEPHLSCEPCLGQQFESSVDGGEAHSRIDLVYEAVEVLAGQVFFCAQKDLQNEITLTGTPQSRSLNMIEEDRPFYLKFVLFTGQDTPLLHVDTTISALISLWRPWSVECLYAQGLPPCFDANSSDLSPRSK